MATVQVVTRECDMPHPVPQPAAPFELFSKVTGRYEVDLCEGCAAKIFAPAVANGRKVPANRKK